MNQGIPNNTPEKNTVVASRFTACNKPQYASGNLVILNRSWSEAAMCKALGLIILIDALHIATSARSGDNPAEAEKKGKNIIGPPAHVRQRCNAIQLSFGCPFLTGAG